MNINSYVSSWLNGIGRADLARKADNNQLPELKTSEAQELFSKWQRNEISREECLDGILSIEVPQLKP
jgi:hypothetical protein